MPKELAPRAVFEAKLAAVYSDGLVPMCHPADKIRAVAIAPFSVAAVNAERKRLKTLTNGDRVLESLGEHRTTVAGVDTIFTLAFSAARHVRKRRILKDQVHYDYEIRGKTVSLIMNHEYDKPAALIGPGTHELGERSDVPRSAAVVVHDEVNNPEHLKALLPIVAIVSYGEFARRRCPEAFTD
jgi:hypothetical protein